MRITKILVVLPLICAIGGHWAFLQSVAWFGMALSYSQTSTLTEALVKTFDGKHPCKLCRVVQEGKKSESKQASIKIETKLDFLLARVSTFLDSPAPSALFPAHSELAQPRADSPPTPPPRSA